MSDEQQVERVWDSWWARAWAINVYPELVGREWDRELWREFMTSIRNRVVRNTSNAVFPSCMASMLWRLMTRENLRYHRVQHPLTMMESARALEISLTAWQEMAVWWHDAMYDPTDAAGHEEVSATVATAVLGGWLEDFGIGHPEGMTALEWLTSVRSAILATANWREPEMKISFGDDQESEANLVVMDLDLINLTWPRRCVYAADVAVCEENPAVLSNGRLFWQMLVDRQFVFRSEAVRGIPGLEARAMATVGHMLEHAVRSDAAREGTC